MVKIMGCRDTMTLTVRIINKICENHDKIFSISDNARDWGGMKVFMVIISLMKVLRQGVLVFMNDTKEGNINEARH